jgi:aspartyl-tRNA(Asn)/glutamyl-tRNA(Gln) amidotransferase subunit C
MSLELSREDVIKVAALARLRLSDDEVDLFRDQLAAVLGHAQDLASLGADNVAPTAHPFGLTNVLRADEIGPSVDREAVLAVAPDAQDGRFGVPRIVGEAP